MNGDELTATLWHCVDLVEQALCCAVLAIVAYLAAAWCAYRFG